ncbi:hypothetical protein ACFWBB_31075 [Streptomyces sp. NPDC060000]|uniref:hypothetical protein n=1 Tax=Streptomyces sp. NPDC060000 TaxID=3347031 RepID=UPI00369057DD
MSEHTPPCTAPTAIEAEDPFPAPVVLSVTATVNGEEVGYRQMVPRNHWNAMVADPPMREGYERALRAHLGQVIVEYLAPPVRVHMPTPMDEARARAEGECCQRLELGSEG